MSRSLLATRLPFTAAIALRYLRSTRRDALVTFLSAVAAGGIALGVAALILALAALAGFQRALKDEILARTPEIEVELPGGADLAAAERAAEEVPGVESAQAVVAGRGWLVAAGKVRPVRLVGYGERLPRSFPGAALGQGEGSGAVLPDELAIGWGIATGEVVEIASNVPTLTPLGPQPRVRRLKVAGTFAAGRTEQEDRVALPLADARRLLGDRPARLEVVVGDLDGALVAAGRLSEVLPAGSVVRTWRDLNRPLFFALRLERTVMFSAVALIVVVAALALVADLALIISSKRPEIGMLGAMGAAPSDLRRIFVLLGGALAGLGGLTGAALGLGGAWALDRFQLLRLPQQVYFLDHVPFAVRGADALAVAALTTALCLAAARIAAGRAAALAPVEALRR